MRVSLVLFNALLLVKNGSILFSSTVYHYLVDLLRAMKRKGNARYPYSTRPIRLVMAQSRLPAPVEWANRLSHRIAGLIDCFSLVDFSDHRLPCAGGSDRRHSHAALHLVWPSRRRIDRPLEPEAGHDFCDTGRALALGSIPIAFAFGWLTSVQLYMVSFIEGTLFIFFGLAEAAALPRVVSQEQLSAATAQNEFVYSVSGLLGPSFSGILYAISNAMPFLADAVSYLISVCSLLFIKTQFQQERTAAPPVGSRFIARLWTEILDGMSWLWHHTVIRFLAVLVGGFELCGAGYVLIVLVIAQQQHASRFATGLILAGGGIGSILGAFIAGPLARRFRVGQLMIIATWLLALTWLPFAFAPNLVVLGLVVAAPFIVIPIHASVQYGYRLASIPDQLQGRVNSVYRVVLFGCQSIGLLLTGVLLQAIGPVLTVLLLFVPQFMLALVATFHKPLRNTPRLSEVRPS